MMGQIYGASLGTVNTRVNVLGGLEHIGKNSAMVLVAWRVESRVATEMGQLVAGIGDRGTRNRSLLHNFGAMKGMSGFPVYRDFAHQRSRHISNRVSEAAGNPLESKELLGFISES
jgi:hypothetical protein